MNKTLSIKMSPCMSMLAVKGGRGCEYIYTAQWLVGRQHVKYFRLPIFRSGADAQQCVVFT